MREIKFRAWSPSKNKMFHQGTQYLASFIRRFVGIEVDFKIHESYLEHPIDFYLQQYTGLKDKNGVEIYEGDIVLDKTDQYLSDNSNVVYEVYYFDEMACFDFKDIRDNRLGESFKKSFEVIGNIYENKELLNV